MIDIGLGEYVITSDSSETLITHALGTCVAIILHCPTNLLTGMAHIVLPVKPEHLEAHMDKPAYYADSFVPEMLKRFRARAGCSYSEITSTVIGGASSKNENDLFQLGDKNLRAVTKVLDDYGVKYNDSETRDHYSRTVIVDINTGEITIRKQLMII